nr:nucleotidyltransferase family protein [uncultured Psychroserpens sp.]
MQKNSNIETYKLIADILNFNNDDDGLKKQLKSTHIDWDNLVKISSQHLVLTTVYCRLKQKNLLAHLPNDLRDYLEELTSINRNRNQKLIDEARVLVDTLDKHDINYVFIKGMALLLGGYYKDLGERMIGDFDVLVGEKDLENTFRLIKNIGYDNLVNFNYERPHFRHLPRQVNKNKLAAIELHRHVLNPSYRSLLSVEDLLSNKVIINSFTLPSQTHLNQINILTTAINDSNYYYNTLNLKNSYDSLVLKLDILTPDTTKFLSLKYTSHFITLNSIWFKQFKSQKTTLINRLKKSSYLLKMKSKIFHKIENITKYITFYLSHRINLLLTNKSYRLYLIKSLAIRKT